MARAIGDGPTLSSVLAAAGPPSTDAAASLRRGWAPSKRRWRRPNGARPENCWRRSPAYRLPWRPLARSPPPGPASRRPSGRRRAPPAPLPLTILNLQAKLAPLNGDLDQAERLTMEAIEVGQTTELTELMAMGVGGGLLFPIRLPPGTDR